MRAFVKSIAIVLAIVWHGHPAFKVRPPHGHIAVHNLFRNQSIRSTALDEHSIAGKYRDFAHQESLKGVRGMILSLTPSHESQL